MPITPPVSPPPRPKFFFITQISGVAKLLKSSITDTMIIELIPGTDFIAHRKKNQKVHSRTKRTFLGKKYLGCHSLTRPGLFLGFLFPMWISAWLLSRLTSPWWNTGLHPRDGGDGELRGERANGKLGAEYISQFSEEKFRLHRWLRSVSFRLLLINRNLSGFFFVETTTTLKTTTTTSVERSERFRGLDAIATDDEGSASASASSEQTSMSKKLRNPEEGNSQFKN